MKILSITMLVILIVMQAVCFQQPEAASDKAMMISQTLKSSTIDSNSAADESQLNYTYMLESERQIQLEISLAAANVRSLKEMQLQKISQFEEMDNHIVISRQSKEAYNNDIDPSGIDPMISDLMVLSETETSDSDDNDAPAAEPAIAGAKAVMKTGSITIARVTAYAPFDNQSGMCNDGNPNSTSTGQRPGPNIVAVDPKKIPYGTKLKIQGFDRVFTAGDTGGILRRYNGIAIDVYFDTYKETRRFGVQYLEIEILN